MHNFLMIDIRQFESQGHRPTVMFTPKRGEDWRIVATELFKPPDPSHVFSVSPGSPASVELFPYILDGQDPTNLFGAAIQLVSNVIDHVPEHSELLWILGHPAIPMPTNPGKIRVWLGLAYLITSKKTQG